MSSYARTKLASPPGGTGAKPSMKPQHSMSATSASNAFVPQRVWFPSVDHGFIPGHIIDIAEDTVTIQPENDRSRLAQQQIKSIVLPYNSIYPAEESDPHGPIEDYDDNCSLMYLNEATLLENVRRRFVRKQIYTYIANMLIAVNPYNEISGLYTSACILKYQGKSLGVLPPHVYAIGDKAFRDMKVTKQSQSIIVSGESGAGKTESTKYILRYLCGSWGNSTLGTGAGGTKGMELLGPIEQKILDANPILESFGNAKTTRNNNSSRFGKFIEIHFEKNCKVAGGFISHYLLEKSRIVTQSPEERNYHIFYQLLAGAPANLKQNMKLDNLTPADFNYLNKGCKDFFGDMKTAPKGSKNLIADPIVNDFTDFVEMEKSFERLGLVPGDRLQIYSVVAAVLHLGNVGFEDDPDDASKSGGCRVMDATEKSLQIACELIGVDIDDLRQALTSRVMQTAKGGTKGTVIMVPLKTYEASSARDALSKALYSRLFDYIVSRINTSIPFNQSSTYIGVLDIAGFEYFTVNSFEQFCINYCNEKLQQFFNERVLHDEQTLYEKEGLGVQRTNYIDNTDCIDLIEGKVGSLGILGLLDEESKLPKPTASHFTSEVQKTFTNHFRLHLPRKSKIKEHRELRDEEGFMIRHFAGAVCYKTSQFIDKNNDALHSNLEALVGENARNSFVKGFFGLNSMSGPMSPKGSKLAFVSVASKFRSQLSELLEKLRSTGTSFIRCIKPNAKMVADVFEGGQILSQLQSAGMTSVLELMQRGFPSRVQFATLYSTYKSLLPPKLAALDPRFFCRALFKALGLNEEDFRFGLTRVFFRPGKFKEFDQLMRNDPESLKQMVQSVTKWILQSKWKKVQYGVLSTIKLSRKIAFRRSHLVTIQKNIRMYLARKHHRPRYLGVKKLRNLNGQIDSMGQTVTKLGDKAIKEKSLAEIQTLKNEIAKAIATIRGNPKISQKEISALSDGLLSKCDGLVKSLSARVQAEKIAKEEAERARKVQEEMERAKKQKEEEERIRREEEEFKRQKAEMEARRKAEEQEAQRQAKLAAAAAAKMPKSVANLIDVDDLESEQEKRDSELAYRLAQQESATVAGPDSSPQTPLKRSNYVLNQQKPAGSSGGSPGQVDKKHDLSGWKYSELRDTINTSCDVQLLEACREEFHRRLKVYHAWKAKNKSQQQVQQSVGAMDGAPESLDGGRAPKSLYQHKASHFAGAPGIMPKGPGTSDPAQQQRYFRIPFTKDGQNKGLWYAHFDGFYIARQMEVHAGKEPILLIAGRDDMQMCELQLNETGLTRKRGAEVLEYEFEKEWKKFGGTDYIRPADRANANNNNVK